jgi:hypothetical protein
MKSAMEARDSDEVAAVLAPSFESVDVSGKTSSAAQMVEQVSTLPEDPRRVSKTTILSAQRDGGTAVVGQRYEMTSTKTQPDGTTDQIVEIVAVSTDTWVDLGGVWLLQRTATDELIYKIDGKVVAHKRRASLSEATPPNE